MNEDAEGEGVYREPDALGRALTTQHEHVVPIPAALRFDSVDEHLRQLERMTRAFPDSQISLDWKHLSSVDPVAGAVIGTALLGSFADNWLVIELPSGSEQRKSLNRTGLTFALANRNRERTSLEGSRLDELDLGFWSRSWSRTADLIPVDGTLFGPEATGEEVVDRLEATQFAAFVNPHLSGSGDRTAATTLRARSWLTGLRPSWRRQLASEPVQGFLEGVNSVINELVENVREHAVLRGAEGGPTSSLLKLALSKDLLYVTVQDNGPGIAVTARPKVESVRPAYSGKADGEIVADLVSGLVPGWGVARGSGLAKVGAAVKAHEGALSIFTRRVRLTSRDSYSPREVDFDLLGTVLIVTLRLPRAS